MAEPIRSFRPRPQLESQRQAVVDTPVQLSDPRKEDLGEAVPLGEPEDEGYVIEEEDRESAPAETEKLNTGKTEECIRPAHRCYPKGAGLSFRTSVSLEAVLKVSD